VDPERNLIYIRGQVPGQVGNYIQLRDAMRKKWAAHRSNLPFPTRIGEQAVAVEVATTPVDPYRVYQQDIGYFSERWKGGD
jgi:large subunit ribosomal protein L3